MPPFLSQFCFSSLRRFQSLRPSYRLLIVWLLLLSQSLLVTALFAVMGLFKELEYVLIAFLGGHPFYMNGLEAQQDALSAPMTAFICLVLTAYMALVLLREPALKRRCVLLLLCELALLLASLSGVFWGLVLNLFAPMCALIILGLGLRVCPLLRWLAAIIQQQKPQA